MKRLIREDYERRNEIVEKIFEDVKENIKDIEVAEETGVIIDQDDAYKGRNFVMHYNYYPLIAWSKGSYQFGDAERKAVDQFVERCYKDAEEQGVDLAENDYEDEFDWFKDEFDYESQYGWEIQFWLKFDRYSEHPEDGYVLYADFIDGNGNKHISDNTAFITMNDDEDTIEKKVSRFMDDLKFSDKNNLKESKNIKENKEKNMERKSNGKRMMKENRAKRTIKEYVEPKTFEDKALFDDFKDSIGGRCFNKDSVYRWVYKLTDIKPTDDEIYDIMDKWVKNKWAYKKENERTGANFYYFDLKETVSESKKILIESSGFERGITNQMDNLLRHIKKNTPKNKEDVREIILTYLDNGNINNNNFIKTIRDIVLYLSRDMRAGIFEDIYDIMYKTIKSDIIPEIEDNEKLLNSFSEAEQKILKYFLDHKDIDKKDIYKKLDATIWNDFNWKENLSNIWKYFIVNEDFDKILRDEIVPYAAEDYVDRYMKETVSEGRKNMKRIMKEENDNLKLIDTFEPKHEISEIGYFGYGTWYDAKYFSKNNSDGWRLPYDTEMKELAKINSDKFKEITGNNLVWMWTATEDVSLSGELDKAVGVNNTGNKGSGYKDEMHNIFLVR